MLYILFLHLSRTIVDHRILKKCLPVLSLRAWRPSSTHEDAEQIYTPIKLPTSHISHLWKGNSTVVSSESFQKNGSELETVRKFFRKLLYLHHISTDFPYVSLQNAIPWSPCPDPDRPDDHLVKPDRLGITSQLPTPIFGADETSSETTSSARSGLVDMELENTYNYIYIQVTWQWHVFFHTNSWTYESISKTLKNWFRWESSLTVTQSQNHMMPTLPEFNFVRIDARTIPIVSCTSYIRVYTSKTGFNKLELISNMLNKSVSL